MLERIVATAGHVRMGDRRRIVIVAPENLLWAAFLRKLRDVPGISLVATSRQDRNLAAIIDSEPLDILIVDGGQGDTLPELPLARIRARGNVRILALATTFEPGQLRALLLEGVQSFLCWQDLVPARLERYLADDDAVVLSPTVVPSLGVIDTLSPDPAHLPVPLSQREQAVLSDLGGGLTQSQIAISHRLSPRTIKRVISNLETKFGATSQFGLGARAAEFRLINPESGPKVPPD